MKVAGKEEVLSFQVKQVIFSKDGFNIISTTEGDKVAGRFGAEIGYVYRATGAWDRTSQKALQYGPTFWIEQAEQIQIMDNAALGKFLTLRFKGNGLGETFFHHLVMGCEDEGLELGRLLDTHAHDQIVDMVGKRNAKKVTALLDAWPKLKPAADLISPLLGYGLSQAQATNLVAMFGAKAVKVLEDDPYGLIQKLEGISFLRADRIALKVGRIGFRDPVRIRAAIATSLEEATSLGSLGVTRDALVRKVKLLVNEAQIVDGKRVLLPGVELQVPVSLIESTIEEMLEGVRACEFSTKVTAGPDEKGNPTIWYQPLLEAENHIVRCLSRLHAPARVDLVEKVEDLVAASGKTLAPEQLEAIRMVLLSPVSIITGGPGCGKSFILDLVLKSLHLAGYKGHLAAPTGKAAKRITEATGRPAQTVHTLVGYVPGHGASFDEQTPLEADYLVLDESSMMDTELMAMAVKACPAHCRLILVGDVDQLPSVGPGQVLRDLIRSETIPVTRLVKGFRFSGGIASAARAINRGEVPENSPDGQFEIVPTDNPGQALRDRMEQLLKEGVALEDIQVLSPTNRGNTGCEALNQAIQAMVNPMAARKDETDQKLERDSGDILVADKVIQVRNDKETGLVNGDIGWIDEFRSDKGETVLSVVGRDKPMTLAKTQAQHLKLAYAITVHKSQGAESPYVLLAIDHAAAFMLRRNLIYTGVTRGSQKVIVFASESVLARGIRMGEPAEGSRRTLLATKLRNLMIKRTSLHGSCSVKAKQTSPGPMSMGLLKEELSF